MLIVVSMRLSLSSDSLCDDGIHNTSALQSPITILSQYRYEHVTSDMLCMWHICLFIPSSALCFLTNGSSSSSQPIFLFFLFFSLFYDAFILLLVPWVFRDRVIISVVNDPQLSKYISPNRRFYRPIVTVLAFTLSI